MITEDYVSFEIAKLLKEKGFEPPHDYRKWLPNLYTDNGEIKWGVWSDDWYPRITLQMAMKWLRENFNMNPVPYATSIGWNFEVFDLSHRDITSCALLYDAGILSKEKMLETYEEACEAGIRYCLENLI